MSERDPFSSCPRLPCQSRGEGGQGNSETQSIGLPTPVIGDMEETSVQLPESLAEGLVPSHMVACFQDKHPQSS